MNSLYSCQCYILDSFPTDSMLPSFLKVFLHLPVIIGADLMLLLLLLWVLLLLWMLLLLSPRFAHLYHCTCGSF